MKKVLIILSLLALGVAAFGQTAPMLSIDYQFNVVAADVANNYLTFKGPVASAAKDQLDAVSGASKLESTFNFNYYRNDIFGKKILPGALRGLFLYPIALNERTDDAITAVKNADGSIRVRFTHRGTANEITTDKSGKITFPGFTAQSRKIGFIAGEGPQVISTDFSPTGKAANIDWAKVWDAKIAGGKVIGTSTSKTGDITPDVANSELVGYEGFLQFAFDGKILKIAGDLKILKK